MWGESQCADLSSSSDRKAKLLLKGRVYSGTRMDTIWAFRQGYETKQSLLLAMPTFPSISYDSARRIKEKQDDYCLRALRGQWKNLGEFPEDLKWEALVDVLRGRVKVSQC